MNRMNSITQASPLTLAYVGYGLRTAMEANPDLHRVGGEDSLMAAVIQHAGELDAEWERRYGPAGIAPESADFVFAYEVAEPFGKLYAELLIEDPKASPKALIQRIFTAADPGFEKRQEDLDIEAVLIAVFEALMPRLGHPDFPELGKEMLRADEARRAGDIGPMVRVFQKLCPDTPIPRR